MLNLDEGQSGEVDYKEGAGGSAYTTGVKQELQVKQEQK